MKHTDGNNTATVSNTAITMTTIVFRGHCEHGTGINYGWFFYWSTEEILDFM